MRQYSLTEINSLLQKGIKNTLSDETMDILKNLSELVGAPEYVKTPQFKNKSHISSVRRKKKVSEINDDDWQTIRNFQTTEILKNEGIEKNLDLIRKNLNMITTKNYDSIKVVIINEIKQVLDVEEGHKYLAEKIFNIVSTNILYSEIYTKLYKDLTLEFNIFKSILDNNFNNFETIFNSIEYFDPEVNYDKFCENNKANENRRALCTFYINLANENVIDINSVGLIIINLFQKLFKFINLKNKTNELDELSELLYVLVVNSYKALCSDHSQIIHEKILIVINIKVRNEPGITNKCIFKHMDMLDEIE